MSRTPQYDMTVFKKRRQRIAAGLKDSALIIFSNPEVLRNYDSGYEYRQDTNFFFLTGFEEPESVVVYRPGQKPEYVLFVRPKDLLRETWDGFRYGVDGAKKYFGADETYLISELEAKLPELLKDCKDIYYRLNQTRENDEVVLKALENTRLLYGRSGRGMLTIKDAWEYIGEYRLIKQDYDLELQRKACEITAQAHVTTMMTTKPGLNEKQVEARVRYAFLDNLSPRQGYNSIVAGGNNACTLHYNLNDQELKDGDLLLIDAGTEWQLYSGDITRTYPINGKFSKAQKEFYEHVLRAQKKIIEMIKPGIAFKTLQDQTIEMLVESLLEMKIMKGSKEEIIRTTSYKKYYPHGVSHWLGMDVHDAGLYQINGESRKLEVGMVFTVEPGLYVPYDDESAPKEFRGLGVRIEDNIIVTSSGCENMTWQAPKEVSDIEALVGKGFDWGIDNVRAKVAKSFQGKKPQDLTKVLSSLVD